MERRLRKNGEAIRNKARSTGRPSECSEQLERFISHFHFSPRFDLSTELNAELIS